MNTTSGNCAKARSVRHYTITIETGPCGVKEIAERFRNDSLVQGVESGTEKVWFPIDAEDQTEAVIMGQDLVKHVFGKNTPLVRAVKAYWRL